MQGGDYSRDTARLLKVVQSGCHRQEAPPHPSGPEIKQLESRGEGSDQPPMKSFAVAGRRHEARPDGEARKSAETFVPGIGISN
jgi:hypothetical protein